MRNAFSNPLGSSYINIKWSEIDLVKNLVLQPARGKIRTQHVLVLTVLGRGWGFPAPKPVFSGALMRTKPQDPAEEEPFWIQLVAGFPWVPQGKLWEPMLCTCGPGAELGPGDIFHRISLHRNHICPDYPASLAGRDLERALPTSSYGAQRAAASILKSLRFTYWRLQQKQRPKSTLFHFTSSPEEPLLEATKLKPGAPEELPEAVYNRTVGQSPNPESLLLATAV